MEIIIGRSANVASVLSSITALRTCKTVNNLRCLCQCNYYSRQKDNLYDTTLNHRTLSQCYLPLSSTVGILKATKYSSLNNTELITKNYFWSNASSRSTLNENKDKVNYTPVIETNKKVSVFQKMKQLARDYWHILIPVHIATSLCWVAIFYVAAKNGVEVIGLMEYLHMPQKYIDMIKNSGAGHWAVVYALYKIFTPFRYTVTVGGTTMSIRYLDKMGYLKFKMPSKKATPSTKSNVTPKETSNAAVPKGMEKK